MFWSTYNLRLSSCNSIKTFDFSSLYTSIPRSKLTDKLKELILFCFIKKNGERRHKYLVLGPWGGINPTLYHSDSNEKFSETDIIKMLGFLIDNIFVTFGGRVFQ